MGAISFWEWGKVVFTNGIRNNRKPLQSYFGMSRSTPYSSKCPLNKAGKLRRRTPCRSEGRCVSRRGYPHTLRNQSTSVYTALSDHNYAVVSHSRLEYENALHGK